MNGQPTFEPDDERIVSDFETLKVFFDPVRSRIIQELAAAPKSIHEVAATLNLPFTRLYYHFHLLEKHGLIRLVETRSLAGAIEEKYYRVTARMFVVDRKLLMVDPGQDNPALEAILETVLEATREDVRRGTRSGLIDLSHIPPHPDALLLRRALLHLTPEGVRYFHQELLRLLKSFSSQHLGPNAVAYNFVIGLYPTSIESETGEESPVE